MIRRCAVGVPRSTLRLAALALALSALALLAAGCTSPATEVLVVVDTDAPARVLSLRVVASRGATRSANPEIHSWVRAGDPDDVMFPASFALVPGEGPRDATTTLQVQLQFAPAESGQPVLTAERLVRFRFTERVPSYVRASPAWRARAARPRARS